MWPTEGDLDGHGLCVIRVGVTIHQGGRESRPQGKGAEVSAVAGQRGRRDAESHSWRGTTRYGRQSGTGKRSALKGAGCVCAVRRVVVSLAQPGGTWRGVLGSLG